MYLYSEGIYICIICVYMYVYIYIYIYIYIYSPRDVRPRAALEIIATIIIIIIKG